MCLKYLNFKTRKCFIYKTPRGRGFGLFYTELTNHDLTVYVVILKRHFKIKSPCQHFELQFHEWLIDLVWNLDHFQIIQFADHLFRHAISFHKQCPFFFFEREVAWDEIQEKKCWRFHDVCCKYVKKAPFHRLGSTGSRLQNHCKETACFNQ